MNIEELDKKRKELLNLFNDLKKECINEGLDFQYILCTGSPDPDKPEIIKVSVVISATSKFTEVALSKVLVEFPKLTEGI